MKHTHRLVSLVLAAALAAGMLAGCGASASESTEPESAAPAESVSSATSESAAESAAAPEESTEDSDKIDYSAGLTEEGLMEGVTALDYVTLPADYAAIPLKEADVTPADENVQTNIDQLLSSYAETEKITDRAIEKDDWVNIDYSGSIDGVKFDGGTAQNQRVLAGSDQFIDDFLTQIIGHKPGETFDVNAGFPDPYPNNPDLAGKESVFEVTVNYIEGEQILPEFNDEFIAAHLSAVLGVDTADAAREKIAADMREQMIYQKALEYVISKAEVKEVPQAAIDYQKTAITNYYKQTAGMYGISYADFLKQGVGVDSEEELLEQAKPAIEESARQFLIMQAVIEDAGLAADEEATKTYFKETQGLDDYSMFETNFGTSYLNFIVVHDLASQFITNNAVIG